MSERPRQPGSRALSPVVGTTLLLGIVVLLVGVTSVVLFGAAETQPPAPEVSLSLDPIDGSDDYRLHFHSGETLDGDRVRIQGVVDPDALDGSTFAAGESIQVSPTRDTVRVVWLEDTADGASYTLQTFAVDPDGASDSDGGDTGGNGGSVATFPTGGVFTAPGDDIVEISGDGGSVSTIHDSASVEILGSPAADVTGDGSADLPFVTDSETVEILTADGDVETVATSSDIPGSIETSKTRVAVGSWDGSPTSVFFVDQNHGKIYRATPSGSPQVAVDLSGGSQNGVQAISGFADLDDDGTDELIYADASQTLRYVQPDGSAVSTSLSLGSNNGIGAGSVGTLAGYSGDVATAVDGGNYLVVVSDSGTDKLTSSDVAGSEAPQAAKAPTTLADVDGDGATELVYVGSDGGKMKFVDEFGSTPTIEFLHDSAGDRIDATTDTGTT